MKRKLLALLTTLCLLVGLVPTLGLSAEAVEMEKPTIEVDGLTYEAWQFGNDSTGKISYISAVALTGVADGLTDVTVPSAIDFTYVNEDYDNGDGTFGYTMECKDVLVHIPHPGVFSGSSVRRLDVSAFSGGFYSGQFADCPDLEELILADGLTTLPQRFCENCPNLRSIRIPDSVTQIGAHAFEHSGLAHIDLPSGLTEIQAYAFRDTNLSGIDLPDGLKTIGVYCFGDTNITELSIPASVTSLQRLSTDWSADPIANPIRAIILEGTDLSGLTLDFLPKEVTVYVQPGVTPPSSLKNNLVLTVGEEAPNFELSYDKTSLDFGTVSPLMPARESQEITVTNTGNAPLESFFFDWKDGFQYFDYKFPDDTGNNFPDTLAPGESFRVQLSPKTTLDPGSYSWDMIIACNREPEVRATLRVKVSEGPGRLFFSEGDTAVLDFGTKNVGDVGPGNKIITIYNGSNKDVTLTVPESEYYQVQLPSNPVVKAKGSAMISIKPKVNTDTPADYSEILHFDPGNALADLKVTYVVNGGALSVSPTTVTFDSLQEGYDYNDREAKTVTIRNTGAAPVTLTKYQVSGNGFEVVSYPSMKLAAGASTTMEVRPKSGLKAGSYSDTLEIGSVDGLTASVKLRLTVTGQSALAANPTTLRFATTPENGTWPAAQTVTLTNAGTEALKLKAPTSKNYTLGSLSRTTLSAGQSATFTVQPKAGLKAGSYNETLTIATDKDTSATVSVSFTVTEAGKTPFVDVPAGIYYEEAVAWAAENNITSGTTATTFAPDLNCSRGQIVTFLYRCMAK